MPRGGVSLCHPLEMIKGFFVSHFLFASLVFGLLRLGKSSRAGGMYFKSCWVVSQPHSRELFCSTMLSVEVFFSYTHEIG